ncbi:hypothetical protein DFH06DRAFT_1199451, partial [Mycena polygramma]
MDLPCDTGAGDFSVASGLPTPFQTEQLLHLLRSNSLPPRPCHLQSVIASSPTNLARYDAEIGRLRLALNAAITERAAFQQYLDRCRSVFSPVRRLPVEILAEVFALCHPEAISFSDPEKQLPDDTLDRLCRMDLLRLSQ